MKSWKDAHLEAIGINEAKYTNVHNKIKGIRNLSRKDADMIANIDPAVLGPVVKALSPMFEEVNEKIDGYRSSYKSKSKYEGKEFDRKLEYKTLDKIQKALEVADKHHQNLQYPGVVDTVTRLWDHLAKASVGIIEYKRHIDDGKYDGIIDMDD